MPRVKQNDTTISSLRLRFEPIMHLEENDNPIGYVQAAVSKSHAEVAWVVGSKRQSNGCASEAALCQKRPPLVLRSGKAGNK